MPTQDLFEQLSVEATLLGAPAEEQASTVPPAPGRAELDALRARVREADQRALDATRVKASAEDELRLLRKELAASETRAREATAREQAALASVAPLQERARQLQVEVDRSRASEAKYLARCIDRGQLTNIKKVIAECNAMHRETVERLKLDRDEADRANDDLRANASVQATRIAELEAEQAVAAELDPEEYAREQAGAQEQFDAEMNVAREVIRGLEEQCAKAERRVNAHREQVAALRKHLTAITKRLGLRAPLDQVIEHANLH